MKRTKAALILVARGLATLFSSCESTDLEERLDTRNDRYQTLQDRRGMRVEARDERSDAWYDRVMR